jgi:hypothetical protein
MRLAHVNPRTLLRLLALPVLFLATACTDTPSTPTATPPPDGLAPLMSYYPDAGVLTSSRDTCPWYDEAPELGADFWASSDSALVTNPDSVFRADSALVADSLYWRDLMVIDTYTGAELFAGRCEVEWNRCNARCRRMPARTRQQLAARAICWGACAARYALCKRREREREQDEGGSGPYSCTGAKLIYDPEEECDYYGGGTGGGGSGGGGGDTDSGCETEWIVVEVNDGTGWKKLWEGYASVCD